MTSLLFMMCQSHSIKKHSSHSRGAWEHLNAGFETSPGLPALTQLVTLGSHLGENCFLWQDCHFPTGTSTATGKINPSKLNCWLHLVIWTAMLFISFNQLQILVFAGFGLFFHLTSVFTKQIHELGV